MRNEERTSLACNGKFFKRLLRLERVKNKQSKRVKMTVVVKKKLQVTIEIKACKK